MRELSPEQIALVATRFRALGEPTRIRIVQVLAQGRQPVSGVVSALHADQSNISKHLQVLFHAGLVTRQRSASEVIYALQDGSLFDHVRALAGRQIRLRRAVARRPALARAADRARARK
jgi:ArsR family transcriptional regulator